MRLCRNELHPKSFLSNFWGAVYFDTASVVGLGMWGKIAELFELDELFKLLELAKLAELAELFELDGLFDGFEAHVEAFHRVGERAD